MGATLLAAGVFALLGVQAVAAVNGAAVLSLPWAGHTNGTLTGGPHNWNGCHPPNDPCTGHHPWNSLDFAPSNAKVYAARGGKAYIHDCASPGMVRIDHGDQYQTTYYHLDPSSIQITADGQDVRRGTYLGNIGTSLPCGGSCDSPCGAHVHFSLWYVPFGTAFNFSDAQAKDWNATQLGAWVLDDGDPNNQTQYAGCITPVTGGTRQCPNALILSDWPSEQVPVARQPGGQSEDLLVRGFDAAGWRTPTDVNGNPLNWHDFGGIFKGSPTGAWNASATQLDIFAIGGLTTEAWIYSFAALLGTPSTLSWMQPGT